MPENPVLPTLLSQRTDGALLSVHLTPRSSKSGIGPFEGDAVRVRVGAAAVDGAANAALIRLLADALRVPPSTIEIVSGRTSRRKRVLFRGHSAAELVKRFRLGRT